MPFLSTLTESMAGLDQHRSFNLVSVSLANGGETYHESQDNDIGYCYMPREFDHETPKLLAQ